MNNWEFIEAEILYNKVTDGTHDSPKYTSEGYPLVTSKNIKDGVLDLSIANLISIRDYEEINKRSKVEQWDVIISMIGEYCGYTYIEKNTLIKYAVKNVGLFKTCSELEANWLSYYLKSDYGKHFLKQSRSGSSQPYISLGALRSLKILNPSFKIKEGIVNAIKPLDDKIELNNRINAELEAMAKTLYDYWFVQFDFPDKNGKPYKTNGGKMIWNEELMREIPEGWESLQLASKLLFEKGIEPGSAEYTDKKESIYHVNFIRVGDVDGSSAIFIDTRQKKYSMVSERDVLVTFDGSVGKVAFGLAGAYSGGLRKIFDKSGLIDNSLIYFIFKDERINRTIHKYATGSILLHASGSINVLKIPYNEEKYLEYQNIILSSYNKMVMNKKENQKLTELRDWLLPMLMNGQVKVSAL
jgi:type I restriction enzyme S subunit